MFILALSACLLECCVVATESSRLQKHSASLSVCGLFLRAQSSQIYYCSVLQCHCLLLDSVLPTSGVVPIDCW